MYYKRTKAILLGAMFLLTFFVIPNVSKAGEVQPIKVKKVLLGDTVRLTLTHQFTADELGLRWFKDGQEMNFNGKAYRKPNADFSDDGVYFITFNLCSRVDTMFIQIVVMSDTSDGDPKIATPGVDNTTNISGIMLFNNQPNPFGDNTLLSFTVPSEQKVTLTVIDKLGNEVAVVFDGVAKQGLNQFNFYPHKFDLVSGTYYYVLKAQNFTDSKPMIIVK
jgi:hypothetical protein